MNARLPDFLIIGAMKCATSSIHEQLARHPGIFMSEPKEPNFFSDCEQWEKGLDWYKGLFMSASSEAMCGESSTHYTKLPTYPNSADRIKETLPNAKLIYVIRHPLDRLVSQYLHEWTTRELDGPINDAIKKFPRLVEYSCYSAQLTPYIERFSRKQILLVFFERVAKAPNQELNRIFKFLEYEGTPNWKVDDVRNRSRDRMRRSPVRDLIIENPVSSYLRKNILNSIISQKFRDRVKKRWQVQSRPTLDELAELRLKEIFDKDLGILGQWLGESIECDSYHSVVKRHTADWSV